MHKSNQLLNEVIQLIDKINKIFALNGDQETKEIKLYRQSVEAKIRKLDPSQ